MFRFQEYINSIEQGKGAKLIRITVLLLMLLGASLVYNINFTRNFTAPEAMDAAQLARNIAEGNGFKTKFIRPVAIDMLRQTGNVTDQELKKSFPDITHPPLYPLLLAGWMKLMPFEFEIDLNNSEIKRYQPEILIYLLNQILFFVALLQVFRLGEKLFDSLVAWCSSLVLIGSELYWQFSASGLSTMLLLVLFLALTKALIRFEEEVSLQSTEGLKTKLTGRLFCITFWIGALIGLGCMTRYGFGLLIIPLVAFIALFGGAFRLRPLGQVGLAELAPNLSGDNLIVIIGPVSFLFGMGLFFSLLDQWKVILPEMRLAGGGLVILVSSLPLLLSFVLAKPYPVADPPYHPARIQYLKSIPKEHGLQELKPENLFMSDLPWAVAWYGNQDSVWLTRNVQPDFYRINDEFRPIRALYFTEITTDQRYVSRVFASNISNWERFVLAIQLNKHLPDGFPLLGVEDAFSPRQWLLFDISNEVQ